MCGFLQLTDLLGFASFGVVCVPLRVLGLLCVALSQLEEPAGWARVRLCTF